MCTPKRVDVSASSDQHSTPDGSAERETLIFIIIALLTECGAETLISIIIALLAEYWREED